MWRLKESGYFQWSIKAPFSLLNVLLNKESQLTLGNQLPGPKCLLPGGLTEEVAAETICICHPGI